MTAFLILLGLLVGAAIGGTVLLVMRDGYGRRPVRPGSPRADPAWGARHESGAEDRIRLLVGAWAGRGGPIVLVRHDSKEEGSPLVSGHGGGSATVTTTADVLGAVGRSPSAGGQAPR